jgi:acyl carrier protein
MTPTPSANPNPDLARFPAAVLEAYQRYRANGDADAVDAVLIAAVIDHRPPGSGPVPAIGDGTRLFEDLGYESVAVAELVFFIEDIFDLTITNDEILAARTIGELRACTARKLAEKARAANGAL